MIELYYGNINSLINVTKICFDKCVKENILFICNTYNVRDNLFTDPCVGIKKFIFVKLYDDIQCFNEKECVYIDVVKNVVYRECKVPYFIRRTYQSSESCLAHLHREMTLCYGTFKEEDVEQRLVSQYLTGKEKVLELGGNIGRVALIVANILNSCGNTDFVSMECNTDIAKQLQENLVKNNIFFHIEPTALSKRKIIQNGWHNVESDELLPEHLPVKNISLQELTDKYNIQFDTLIIDCEEAFYVILMDFPEILNKITLLIMENDYLEQYKKEYVDKVLCENHFEVVYSEKGGWPEEYNRFPCYKNFYEVWKLNCVKSDLSSED